MTYRASGVRTFVDLQGAPLRAHVVTNPDYVDIVSPSLCTIHREWASGLEIGKDLPGLRFLENRSLVNVAQNLMLLEPVNKKTNWDFVYRRYGESIASAYGIDMTGKKSSDYPETMSGFFSSIYNEVVATLLPIYTLHAPLNLDSVYVWERLILPISHIGKVWLIVVNLPHPPSEQTKEDFMFL